MSDQVSELSATLLYRGRPDPNPDPWVREWESWDYNCRIEHRGPGGADVFKGGAFTMVRFAEGAPELPWDDLEQQATLLRGVPDTFDHATALAAAEASDHHAAVTVRILEPGPWIILTELLIGLAGLVAATGATAVWLPHCQALFTGEEFLGETEALRIDEDGGSSHPYALYMSIQLRLPLERGGSAVGFTRGLGRLGWPDFELEDFARAPPPALVYRVVGNAGMHQLVHKGAIGPEEFMLTSVGRIGTGAQRRSHNFEGEVLPLRFLD